MKHSEETKRRIGQASRRTWDADPERKKRRAERQRQKYRRSPKARAQWTWTMASTRRSKINRSHARLLVLVSKLFPGRRVVTSPKDYTTSGEVIIAEFPVGNRIVDIAVLPELLAVENDEQNPNHTGRRLAKDEQRDEELYDLGWVTVRARHEDFAFAENPAGMLLEEIEIALSVERPPEGDWIVSPSSSPERKACECGCGELASPGKRFVFAHHLRTDANPMKNPKTAAKAVRTRWGR